jgi:hypothetical protein
MMEKLMILPSRDPKKMRLVKVPDHFEEHEIYRVATGVIASVEASIPDYDWADIYEKLEEHGFTEVPFILGPEV